MSGFASEKCRHGVWLAAICEDCLLEGSEPEAEYVGLLNVVHPPEATHPLPKMVRVEWMRGGRRQTSVGFLVAEGVHLVLADQYDGKHPLSGRLRTIHVADVCLREELQ